MPADTDYSIVGDGNVATWSAEQLRNVARLCDVAIADILTENDHAVYVIADALAACVKIGVARLPSRRLAALQTGNPNEIFLHRVFWFDGRKTADRIERLAHKMASARYRRMAGEWFECWPQQAHEIIERAASQTYSQFCVVTPSRAESNA